MLKEIKRDLNKQEGFSCGSAGKESACSVGDLALIPGHGTDSVGKESPCNAGDPHLIPGSGRSAGEGIGYPLLYSWASLVAQLVKNPPAM